MMALITVAILLCPHWTKIREVKRGTRRADRRTYGPPRGLADHGNTAGA